MLVAWTSQFLSKPGGLTGPAGSAGLLAVVSYTKSRQEANFDSRFWRGIGNGPSGKATCNKRHL